MQEHHAHQEKDADKKERVCLRPAQRQAQRQALAVAAARLARSR
jgi:hypothetical protein